MRVFTRARTRLVAAAAAVTFAVFQASCFFPRAAHAGPEDDLKQIEYKHYFRGDYKTAIEKLRAFLARADIAEAQALEAKEFLAASLILSGGTAEGKAVFLDLLQADARYSGPDPSVFKSEIVSAYEEAKSEYASRVIRAVPEDAGADADDGPVPAAAAGPVGSGKPFYKKWWFYATMGALGVVIAGAAGASGGDSTRRSTGDLIVTVEIQ